MLKAMLILQDAISLLQARKIQWASPDEIHHLLIDSRKLAFPAKALFIAIVGQNHDAHHFIAQLYQKGVRNFIVQHLNFPWKPLTQANILQVKDSQLALQELAAYHRKKFKIPVIGITGSNAKTIVKEWLSQVLHPDFKIVRSPKSYNSQVGVPLSVWQINDWHNLGIFEAGISQKDEMSRLEKIIQPTTGIFTNIGSAHDEGFPNREEKIREKLKLFPSVEILFYCQDHQAIHQAIRKEGLDKYIKTFTWGKHTSADVQVCTPHPVNNYTQVSIKYQKKNYQAILPFLDAASVENALHCLAYMLYLGIDFSEIQRRLRNLKALSTRLELKRAESDSYLIDDTYNNDLAGLRIALDFLSAQDQKPKKIAIISDVLESGLAEEELYQSIAQLLKDKEIQGVIGIGEQIALYQSLFPPEKYFFKQTSAFLACLLEAKHPIHRLLSQAIILIKGARVFKFERIVQALQQKTHGTVLEINLDAVAHNLNFYRSQLKPHTKLMVMVKALAYGSGIAEIASLLQFHRVDYLGVAYVDEGVALRKNGIHLPIMVLNPDEESFEKILQYKLEPEMYNFRMLERYLSFDQFSEQETYRIHLNLDTGMRRLGFEIDEIDDLGSYLRQHLPPYIKVASIYSHLAGADEQVHTQFSQEQIKKFQIQSQKIEEALGYKVIKHILNSPGILRFPEAQLDMVRLGVGLYGIEANQIWQNQLRFISTLKTTISQMKDVKKGETIGYGRRGQAAATRKIATIAIGYADGFYRALSNGQGRVLIKSKDKDAPKQFAPVIGNVCMDMTMIDVTGLEVQEGSEVIIFGEDHPILDMAKRAKTIPYEILTSISERVKRIFYTE